MSKKIRNYSTKLFPSKGYNLCKRKDIREKINDRGLIISSLITIEKL